MNPVPPVDMRLLSSDPMKVFLVPFERSIWKKTQERKKMDLRKICIALLALLVAAMVIVPMGSADTTSATSDMVTKIEKNFIAEDTAFQSATAAVKDFISRSALDSDWEGATVNPTPVIIYDLNGKPLFYLFSVEKNGKRIGEIKAAASKVIGGSIVTIGPGAGPVDMDSAKARAKEIISREYKGAAINSIDLVCYNYPDIGIMFRFSIPGAKEDSLVLDAYDFSVIPESQQLSYYNEIRASDISTRIANAQSEQEYLLNRQTGISPKSGATKTLSGFPLYPQLGSAWCPFATAQMISGYYGYSRTQTGIASTMGIANPDNGATIQQSLSNYYQVSTASGGLGKPNSQLLWTGQFTYDDFVNNLNANRPQHTDRYETSSYHARAVAGYSYSSSTSQYLYIYDPGPVNVGSLYWENYNIFMSGSNPVHGVIFIRN
jgi:hypothetical protein